eukprot:m.28007 g.28007  ORF g.28007 m.28007 type:complete len:734 (-) comp9054_c0_seq3:34-2235(-)
MPAPSSTLELLYTFAGFFILSNVFAVSSAIWFFPLDLMRISGFEVAVLCFLSPGLCSLGWIQKQCTRFYPFLLLLATAGPASFFAPTLALRLGLVSFAASTSLLAACGMLARQGSSGSLAAKGLSQGLLVLLVTRTACYSLNPLNLGAAPALVFTVLSAALALILMILDPQRRENLKSKALNEAHDHTAVSEGHHASSTTTEPTSTSRKTTPEPLPNSHQFPSRFSLGLALGSALFLIHTLAGDASVLARYTGLTAIPPLYASLLSCLCVAAGLARPVLQSLSIPRLILVALLVMSVQLAPPSSAFVAGLILLSNLSVLFHKYLHALSLLPPGGAALFLAMATYTALVFASVWTVAYNFVPYGELLRESTHLVFAVAAMLLILPASMLNQREPTPSATPQTKESSVDSSPRNRKAPQRPGILVIQVVTAVLVVIVALRIAAAVPVAPTLRNQKDSRLFSATIWTVHFGFDNRGWPNTLPARDFVRNFDSDIVGLLETDLSRPYLGSPDMVAMMAETLGYYSDYGPPTRDHTWGCALLSRFPILHTTHHLLPSPHGELAPALAATLDVAGTNVTVVVTHMGNEGDVLDRELQTKALGEILSNASGPAIFLGYMSGKPYTPNYRHLIEVGRMQDIEPLDRSRFCEFIFFRDLEKLTYCRISRGKLSDTEAQMAVFRLPVGPARSASKRTIGTAGIPDTHRCPAVFGEFGSGHVGEAGHRYHMATPVHYTYTDRES